MAPLTPAEIRATLPPTPAPRSAPGSLDDEDDRARDDLARLVHAISDGRPSYARLIAEASAGMAPRGGCRSGQRAELAARARRLAVHRVPLLLRAAPAPRARLRRAEGDPRRARRGRAADADRDRAPPAADAGIDEGLSLVAGGRRPDRLAAEALQLRRPDAAPLGPPALPRRARRATKTSRARCTRTSSRGCPTPSPRSRSPASRRPTPSATSPGGLSRLTDGGRQNSGDRRQSILVGAIPVGTRDAPSSLPPVSLPPDCCLLLRRPGFRAPLGRGLRRLFLGLPLRPRDRLAVHQHFDDRTAGGAPGRSRRRAGTTGSPRSCDCSHSCSADL